MKNALTILLLAFSFLLFISKLAFASEVGCWNRQEVRAAETDSWNCIGDGSGSITKTVHWRLYWLDGYQFEIDPSDTGRLGGYSFLPLPVPHLAGPGLTHLRSRMTARQLPGTRRPIMVG